MTALERQGSQGHDVQVLTFDFHNTLANCDPWFDLEVRDLPWAVVQHLAIPLPATAKAQIDAAYRALRLEVIDSGNEVDAYDAVTRVLEPFDAAPPAPVVISTVDALMYRAIDFTVPVPGAVDAVGHLHAAGVCMGVVSSAVHHRTLDWILERIGIAGCFDQVVTSASSGFYKSTPAIFESALLALDGTASASVHVGDSLRWDVATAQRAGMTAVWLRTARHNRFATGPASATPSMTLATLEGAGAVLLELLERLGVPADA